MQKSEKTIQKQALKEKVQASQALIFFILFIVTIFFLGVFRDKKYREDAG